MSDETGDGTGDTEGNTATDRVHADNGGGGGNGRGGADVFAFAPDHGYDTIANFTAGTDKIDLSAFKGISGMGDFFFWQSGDDTMIYLGFHDGGGMIRLEDVSVEELSASDFTFHRDVRTGADPAQTVAGGAGDDANAGFAACDPDESDLFLYEAPPDLG